MDNKNGQYIKLKNVLDDVGLQKGDIVLITSDVTGLLYSCIEHGDDNDLNVLIDNIIRKVGADGTVLFPTYNWDFCKGKTFDYKKTKCRTGALGTIALKRSDFLRTKHPIYSFAVWGKDKEYLFNMNNESSFGADSPFAYLHKNAAKNLFIGDVSYQHSFTYVHYVEEMAGNVEYRYLKPFTAKYIDENGVESERTYSMFVRDLDKDVVVTINPIREDFIQNGIEQNYEVNDIKFRLLDLGKAYDIIEQDIRQNKSRKLCTYLGQ